MGAAAFAFAGDQGDSENSCDGSAYEMVDCLKAKTAYLDKRIDAGGCMRSMTEARARELEGAGERK